MKFTNLTNQKRINNIKTFLILLSVTVFIILFGTLISTLTGNTDFIWIAFFVSVLGNVISYFFSDKIAISMAHAEMADKNKYGDLYAIIENLTGKDNLPMPKVYIINDPAPNAFATGRNANHSSVAFTTGLLAMMDRGELEGVIAHELSHIKNKDILIMTVVVALAGILSTLANLAVNASIFGGDKENKNATLLLVFGILASIFMPFAAMIIQSSISRKREFMADAGGALLTQNPDGLANALRKISGYAQPMRNVNQATAHLYISNPFGSLVRESFFQRMFMTHPPVEERIAALLAK
jgi:heat shock protein HtpX